MYPYLYLLQAFKKTVPQKMGMKKKRASIRCMNARPIRYIKFTIV
ncbi:hypothetical protein TREVI0001_1867 [Treponema vincentii ATCC 35580]|uniref:Uncharacterized protein n=1 Tax=Treponema vincentii ATCC 35580 TaxID=596324 RepID=C8PPC5_9SPIR|nr:hypothetical protein TREVI0001_1867 [Treponema vincentii ATCC 35580]